MPGLRQLGSSDMSVSLCDLCMWFVQHGGVKGPRLVTWRLDAPSEHVLREKDPEESYVAFYDRPWKSRRVTSAWSQACPDSSGGFTDTALEGGVSAPRSKEPRGMEGTCWCGHLWKIKSHDSTADIY